MHAVRQVAAEAQCLDAPPVEPQEIPAHAIPEYGTPVQGTQTSSHVSLQEVK